MNVKFVSIFNEFLLKTTISMNLKRKRDKIDFSNDFTKKNVFRRERIHVVREHQLSTTFKCLKGLENLNKKRKRSKKIRKKYGKRSRQES